MIDYCDPDPKGDVELVLKTSDVPFALWDAAFDFQTLADNAENDRFRSTPDVLKPKFLEPGVFHGKKKMKTHRELQAAEPVNGHEGIERLSTQDADLPEPDRPSSAPFALLSLNEGLELPEIRMRVSSRHLTLASTYFERMLRSKWKEGHTLASNGSVSIPVMDCDPQSLMILMNIIHGHTRKVPRSVSLDMLARIAVLVDYFECAEAAELFTDTWIDHLKEPLPTTYGRSLILWTCVAWVFRKPAVFTRVTAVAQKQSYEPIQTLGLPIPQNIVG